MTSQSAVDLAVADGRLETLDRVGRRVLWLSTQIVHHANRVRPNPDLSKVGGHQASSASVSQILTALYFDFLRAGDRVSVKPHASPVFHAIQYLLGFLDKSYLPTLRTADGLQAYPSRTKDPDPVDFSTGSVGLGAVAPNFAALAADYTRAHFGTEGTKGRYIAVVGDAELDEGSVWEAVAEPALAGLDNVIWIIDLNRQSLDRVVPGIRAERLRAMFAANGWQVIDAKYGHKLQQAFAAPSGELLRARIDEMPNDHYQRMVAAPASETRERLGLPMDDYTDTELHELVADLGGHDLALLADCLHQADAATVPSVIFAYTIKGWGLPFAGDPSNHSALLTNEQIDTLRGDLGIGADPWASFEPGTPEAALCEATAERLRPGLAVKARPVADVDVPEALGRTYPADTSTQAAFGLAIGELGRLPIAGRIVTTSPDVATSTNLGGWINRTGVWGPKEHPDVFADGGPRPLKWREGPTGQHIELGISEMNLFLLLGALGLTNELDGELLLPIGTLYDPFIARGLDAFIYALYQGARFIVAGTPSGVTLSPEGGAHQSVITPSIGMELPGITYWEPAFAVETEWILLDALHNLCDRTHGRSSYLRLSTKPVDQQLGPTAAQRADVLSGGYRLIDRSSEPGYTPGTNVVHLAVCGAMVPEAIAASQFLRDDDVHVNVLNITSPDKLYRTWQTHADVARANADTGQRLQPLSLLRTEERRAPCITLLDGHPHTLAWLPGALGCVPGPALGVTDFGRSGTRADLYGKFGIDTQAIVDACAAALST